jgi:hypothetical protein
MRLMVFGTNPKWGNTKGAAISAAARMMSGNQTRRVQGDRPD